MSIESGSVTVYYGPMFSGKTSALLRWPRSLKRSNTKYILLKKRGHKQSDSDSEDLVSSHDGTTHEAYPVDDLCDILDTLKLHDCKVVLIDEGQFFDDLPKFIDRIREMGKACVIAMLDGTFERKPWPTLGEVIAKATEVEKMYAICEYCGGKAPFSMKIAGDNNLIDHAACKYASACNKCWKPFVAPEVAHE